MARQRFWHAAVVGAVALVACGDGSDGEPSVDDAGADAAAMMNTALGGTQSVQDFLVYLDMAVQTDEGPVSYYDEVLERAAEGAGERVELAGGYEFAPVDSLEGDVRDSSGEVVPTLSLAFGLLDATAANRLETANALAELAGVGDPRDLPFGLGEVNREGGALFVEIFTAGFDERRTHVGPGDVGAKDLTFVSGIAPGDDLTSAYAFGQTFPGDPAEEVGLSPHELFSYRWNRGLVTVSGSAGGVDIVFDDDVIAIEGSTLVLTEAKAIAVANARNRATAAVLQLIAGMSAHDYSTGPFQAPLNGDAAGGDYLNVAQADDGLYWMWTSTEGYFGTISAGDPTRIPLNALKMALLENIPRNECRTVLNRLLMQNEAMFGPLAQAVGAQEPEPAGASTTIPRGPDARGYCSDPMPPVAKAAGTYGDVHITTFDGWSYDNQAAGEFLVFQNGTATVQMRSAPWPGSDAVSVVTAVAVRVGDHEISMHQDNRIHIDGQEPTLARGETIAVGDAALLWTGAAWVIVWPDGTEIRVSGGGRTPPAAALAAEFHPLLMLITVTGSEALGMMGTPDGDGSNDWVTRAGEQLDHNIRFDFENFYPSYIDTWRISDDESLFHYAEGETTATFTIDGFPRIQYDVADLDPDARAAAEAACGEGGIERPEMFDGCVLDVALTDDVGFVYDTYLAQRNTSPPAAVPATTVPETPAPAEGESVVSVGPLTVRFGAEPPVAVPNNAVQWQCQVGDGTFSATSRFQETEARQYEITIDYLDAEVSRDGSERFTLIVKRNSDPVAWMQNTVEPMPGTLDAVVVDGSTLRATGTALLNDPFDPAVFPGGASFGTARLEPLTLEVNCDR